MLDAMDCLPMLGQTLLDVAAGGGGAAARASGPDFVPTAHDITTWVAMGMSATIAVVWLVVSMVRAVVRTTTRERTKREIAAYVAEGSITPDQAERIIAAGEKLPTR